MICGRLNGWVKARSKGAAWWMGFCGSYDIGFVGLEEGSFGVKWGWMSAPGSCYFLDKIVSEWRGLRWGLRVGVKWRPWAVE